MIYLDHNATTPLLPEAWEAMQEAQRRAWANPGSRHAAGRAARLVLESAREELAQSLGARPEEVIFTSGGTESINMALRGFAHGRRGRFILPPGEHSATEQVAQELVAGGWQCHRLTLDSQGRLQTEGLAQAPWSDAAFAAVLLAHNETGVIQELTAFRNHCEQVRLPWHVDAVQAVGKIPVHFHDLGCTTMALAAHKFGGPRGMGALLVRSGVTLPPLLRGGHQERGLRAGTEPVMLAAGMAAALRVCQSQLADRAKRLQGLRDQLVVGLRDHAAPAVVHGAGVLRLPNTLSIGFPGCAADALVVALDLAGVCCSVGSACASGSTKVSPILTAMETPLEVAQGTIRLSLGWSTTEAEVQTAVDRIARVVRNLRGQPA